MSIGDNLRYEWSVAGTDTLEIPELITVNPTPLSDFYFEKINTEPSSTIQFYDDSSSDAIKFWWDFGDGATSDDRDPRYRYSSRSNHTATHVSISAFGCADTSRQVVRLDTLAGLFIPNILEPDHPEEGKNRFIPKGIGLANFHIAVYARNGQLMWESSDLDEKGMPTGFWDGNYRGQPMPPSVYVWRVTRARFIDGKNWSGMKDEHGRLRKSHFLYLVR